MTYTGIHKITLQPTRLAQFGMRQSEDGQRKSCCGWRARLNNSALIYFLELIQKAALYHPHRQP